VFLHNLNTSLSHPNLSFTSGLPGQNQKIKKGQIWPQAVSKRPNPQKLKRPNKGQIFLENF